MAGNDEANSVLSLPPVPELLRRLKEELAADFAGRPLRISRATYCGDHAVAVALAPRDDGQVQAFCFNRYDEQVPFTLRVPISALAELKIEVLRKAFAEPGRSWAAPSAGCLAILHEQMLVNLQARCTGGFSIATLRTGGTEADSAPAIAAATLLSLITKLDLQQLSRSQLATLSQQVLTRLAGHRSTTSIPEAVSFAQE